MESKPAPVISSNLMVVRSRGWSREMLQRHQELIVLSQGTLESLMPDQMAELAILTILLVDGDLSHKLVVATMNRLYNYDWITTELEQAIENAASYLRSI
ncbi:MAG TPA: hypothetical protein VLA77_01725 [Candidatus Saccharimonadales bacterium]|nr:hypothetical protein [Candidatus Saccharimonadales bacterium]